MQKWVFLLIPVGLGVIGTALYGLRAAPDAVPAPVPQAAVKSPQAAPIMRAAEALPQAPVVQPERASVPVPAVIDQSRPAEVSMAEAREKGDPRTPPIARAPETETPPTAAELADPQLYQRYEQRQNSKAYADYVKATDAQIPLLQQQLAEARQQGISPEQLAVGEEKLRRMQAMRDQLVSQHPEISH